MVQLNENHVRPPGGWDRVVSGKSIRGPVITVQRRTRIVPRRHNYYNNNCIGYAWQSNMGVRLSKKMRGSQTSGLVLEVWDPQNMSLGPWGEVK